MNDDDIDLSGPMELYDPTPSNNPPTVDIFSAQRALRPTLTEPSFRKYEIYIAIAAQGSYGINSRKEPVGHLGKGVSRHTFAISLRDAIMGWGKYGYRSSLIPSTLEYDSIKVQELEGDDVAIINIHLNRLLSGEEVLSLKLSLKKSIN